MAFPVATKRIAVAGVERYGMQTMLELWSTARTETTPSKQTVHNWVNDGIEPGEADRKFWADVDGERSMVLRAKIFTVMDMTLDSYKRACAADKFLGMQQAATAMGILYDKLAPKGTGPATGDAGDALAAIGPRIIKPYGPAEIAAPDDPAVAETPTVVETTAEKVS